MCEYAKMKKWAFPFIFFFYFLVFLFFLFFFLFWPNHSLIKPNTRARVCAYIVAEVLGTAKKEHEIVLHVSDSKHSKAI